jgi:hypothetical protein
MSDKTEITKESEDTPKNEPAGIGPQDTNAVNSASFARQIQEKTVDTTLSSRYEMKYLISVSQAVAIERFVRDYLPIDHYSSLVPDGYYPIVSDYLDSPDFRLCRESLTGVLNRFKLRIRSYSDDLSYPRFFEIKRRANIVIIKSRSRVRAQDIKALLSGRFVPPQSDSKKDFEALKLFQLYCASINAFPLIRIRYLRKAYEGSGENRVRVTFDKDLCFNTQPSDEVLLGGEGWRPNNVSLHGIILEIKFTGRFPVWLNRMAKFFNLRQRSMSKYTASVQNACLLGFCAPTMPFNLEQ